MADFRMPSLGADMETGTVSEWLVKPGDSIRKGDPIAVIDTDKALIEVESFHTGVVGRLVVNTGERVPVGTTLAVVDERTPAERAPAEPSPPPPEPSPAHVLSPLVRRLAAERGMDLTSLRGTGPGDTVTRADVERAAGPEGTAPPGRTEPAAGRATTGPATVPAPPEPPEPARSKASPLARRLARELDLDLATVPGTGRTGAVRADDVRRAAAVRSDAARHAPPVNAPGQAVRQDERREQAMRQAIARAMTRSKREIPHYYLTSTIDMSTALAWLRERNRELPVSERVLPAALLLKAAATAAAEVPRLNGFWIDDGFVPGEAVHLGMAISLKGGGLIAPALHDAAGRDLADLMAGMKDLVSRVRSGRLRAAEMTEATMTVTNLGDQGVESVHGVIYPPQVALVGFGRILERPWAVHGLLGVRPLVTVTLAADHRATDGYTGGRFLAAVGRLLDHPAEL
ncbi:2-oxo acid dehydrogenase subunit E2 [Nonomuraea muscovyensis]|uniref:2-oxo acid dehydrogenase subunit E2 n=1 Tax=Nonomuraea muscovyensis TaxID=1124761 RepID=UPI0034067B23